jgi:putative hemolysin
MLYFEMLIVIVLILINGAMAMSEMAVISSRKARLQQMAADGNRGASAALDMIAEPTKFLSTVQIGITLVGVSAGAFSGAALGDRLGDWLEQFALTAQYSDALGTGLVVITITYLSLIIGELVPKRLALANAERIAALIALPMSALSSLAAPLVWLLKQSTDSMLKVLGVTKGRATTVTEDEIKSLIADGTAAGVFAPQEREMIEGVLRLADRTAKAIMTPRAEITWIDRDASPEQMADMLSDRRHSRLLVCEGAVDHPIGMVQTKAMLPLILRKGSLEIGDAIEPVPFVQDWTPVLQVLERFKREHVHMAVVTDEHGSLQGILTITDILEGIAGDLPERGEDTTPIITRRDDGSLLVDGSMLIDAFEDYVGVSKLSVTGNFHTVAGLALERLGHVPEVAESFEYRGLRFEIVDMDGRRIDKLMVMRLPKENE